jgi:uncharacterized membrane protein
LSQLANKDTLYPAKKNNKLAQQMNYNLKERIKHLLAVRLQLLVMIRWLLLALNGQMDVYTYDLLHIAIYSHNNKNNALAFLLALRAKG